MSRGTVKTHSKHSNKRTWVIRAGRNGSAHELFTHNNVVVLDDPNMGDLRLLPRVRSAFYDLYSSRHPEKDQVAVKGIGGKLFRFVHEVQIGDLMLYPCIVDQQIYIGETTSAYYHDQSLDSRFPHRRGIKWFIAIPKKSLSVFAQRELGAARTFFLFTTLSQEVQATGHKIGGSSE
jgi:restriction system protein